MKKKKILLLSDDLRMHSGIATQSKEFVIGTIQKYDWVQIGAAIKHPESGKIIDMSQSVQNEYGVKNAFLKIYPTDGYGNPDLLREILQIEKPDAILHFTDPRFWIWLYEMEHEIRQNIPIIYYNIWDDLPDPDYNENYYRSSDMLMAISKQTYGINKRLLPDYEDWQIQYVPHGLDENQHFKVDINDVKYQNFLNKSQLDKFKFKILFLNRNIRRKQPGDVVLAYKTFLDQLSDEQKKECCLVFHTQISDENGTDLRAVCNKIIPDENVIFTYETVGVLDDKDMNHLYNAVDVYINLASNEGFGLGSAEALMAETPIIVNVTGGLQDQCGFKKQENDDGDIIGWSYLDEKDYIKLGSNHRGKYREHGEWVKPVFPSNISLQGSPLTPYIFDDRCEYKDAGNAIKYWFDKTPEERNLCGKKGKQFLLENRMCGKKLSESFINNIEITLKNWKPKQKYTLEVI